MSEVITQVAKDLSEKLWDLEQQLAVQNRLIRQHALTRARSVWVDYHAEREAQDEAKRLDAKIVDTMSLFEEMKERLAQ